MSDVVRGPRQEQLLLVARFRHVLAAICAARHGFGTESDFRGDHRAGLWFTGHDSEDELVAWNEHGAIALAMDVGEYVFNERLSIQELFAAAPDVLQPLVAEAIERTLVSMDGRDPTAALWLTTDGARDVVGRRNESPQFDDLLREPLDAYVEAGLMEFFGLTDSDGDLALALAERSSRGRFAVTIEQAAAILAPGPEDDPIPSMAHVRQAVALLAQMGIDWPDAEVTAARAAEDQARERELGDVDRGLALLRAVENGDLGGVVRLLASGANVDRVAPPGWLTDGSMSGATPLCVAAAGGWEDITAALLDHGVSPDQKAAGTRRTPLWAAAERRHLGVCRLLLARGITLPIAWYEDEGSILEACRWHQDATLIRLFLDAGTTLPSVRMCQDLAAIARRSGEEDLVPRLLPEGR